MIMKIITTITALVTGFFLAVDLTAEGVLPIGQSGQWPTLIPMLMLVFAYTFFSVK